MADSEYPDDIQFAGLVQAATAAADEQTRSPSLLGKRKRSDSATAHISTLHADMINDAPDPAAEIASPRLQSPASVLFREPSSKSKKYSRPPLGKVFASLELAPENFLRLQTAAKAFMLDEAHPERRDVIGQKKSVGGTDIAKLKLWNTVEEFLSVHGYGEKYFAPGAGDTIPGAPPRTLIWPQDSHAIIKLMMPLMRKMVTNERQRVYAAATRRQGSTKGATDREPPAAFDASLVGHGDVAKTSYSNHDKEGNSPAAVKHDVSTLSASASHPTTAFKQSIVLYVNVVANTGGALRRVIPRFTLTPESAPTISSLVAEVERKSNGTPKDKTPGKGGRPIVKVWLPDGLVTVAEDGEWMVALLSAGVVDWMDGEVRVLVEV
ncbi:hypothetical protein A1O3_09467 [Capronia epimyces CBS 606.96]|uniref:Uncharacterized protein n=1 Tax=Capronia epimyces CBS 606.96 TaxID=1182542 RepID=W9XMV7_9EURO|nr:uncharacterized protein A1O3_09467 [Capronia epimyces CBS 606.96]EXJ78306.1 hypothetical protein A1O3_09467 [Capronia epimyces CBS 606.96]